jgi:hypothetical protein
MSSTTATETADLTVLDALTEYIKGRVKQARQDESRTFRLTTVDVQTRVMSRCREWYGVIALPTTFTRKFRKLRNRKEKLRSVGVKSMRVVESSPLTIEFTITDE